MQRVLTTREQWFALDFLKWLTTTKGLTLCEWDDAGGSKYDASFYDAKPDHEKLLVEYMGLSWEQYAWDKRLAELEEVKELMPYWAYEAALEKLQSEKPSTTT